MVLKHADLNGEARHPERIFCAKDLQNDVPL